MPTRNFFQWSRDQGRMNIPRAKRFCILCEWEIENNEHFLCRCAQLSTISERSIPPYISPYIGMQDAMKITHHWFLRSLLTSNISMQEMNDDNGDHEYQDVRNIGHTSTRSWRSLLTMSNPHKDTYMNLLHRWSHLKIRCLRCGSSALTYIWYQIYLTYNCNYFVPNTFHIYPEIYLLSRKCISKLQILGSNTSGNSD